MRSSECAFLLVLVALLSHVEGYWNANLKVNGTGLSLIVKTPRKCLSLCEMQSGCDAVNYHAVTHKCRIFTRCTPTAILHNSTQHYFYSKRPMVPESGYLYHPESDSCIKLVQHLTDFTGAEALCKSHNGRLVALTDNSINQLAVRLISMANTQFVWIGLTDKDREGDPVHSNGKKTSEVDFFPVAKQGLRNDPNKNCWSLSDSGEWVEHSCKQRKQYSICQIPPYKSR